MTKATAAGAAAIDAHWGETARHLTDAVTVLVGADNGAYPSGNSVVVRGAGETIMIDPSTTVVERNGAGIGIDPEGGVRLTTGKFAGFQRTMKAGHIGLEIMSQSSFIELIDR